MRGFATDVAHHARVTGTSMRGEMKVMLITGRYEGYPSVVRRAGRSSLVASGRTVNSRRWLLLGALKLGQPFLRFLHERLQVLVGILPELNELGVVRPGLFAIALGVVELCEPLMAAGQ